MVNFITIWNNHPGYENLCNFENQCAIRMGTAFLKSKINMSSYTGVRCWEQGHNNFNHTLRAQELADWIDKDSQQNQFGSSEKKKNVTYKDYINKHGLVFFKDGWGPTDHIDIWNGNHMKAGSKDYFSKAKEVWFWSLP